MPAINALASLLTLALASALHHPTAMCRRPNVRPHVMLSSTEKTAPQPHVLKSEIPGLWRMSRPNTIPMGFGLVAIGAFGARRATTFVGLPYFRLLLGSLLTLIVTSGSMLINDYHDHNLGVDNEVTKPGRPLVTGEVRPSAVKFVLKWGYALHLTMLCLVDMVSMRLWILANTLLTYLYSVHLKPVTGIKNMVCAAIVSMAVGLGAVAMGGRSALLAVWRPMAAVAGLIWHREIIMDIKDADGDASAGVRTLPVKFGKAEAHTLSYIPLAVGAGLAATAGRPGLAAAGFLGLQGACSLTARVKGYTKGSLAVAIEFAPLWLIGALVSLTV